MKKDKRQTTIYKNRYERAVFEGAKKIKIFRLCHQISQREMAAKLGVVQQAVSAWEKNRQPATKYIKIYVQEAAKRHDKLTIEEIINDY